MTKYLIHQAATAFLLALATSGFGQDSPMVKATVDRNEILIGQPIDLKLEATFSSGSSARWSLPDSLAHFEWVAKNPIDSAESNGLKSLRQELLITSFDSGIRVIPPLPVVVDNRTYYSDSIRVLVNYSKMDPNQDYHDIKDIIDVENPYVKYVIWALAAITLLCIGGVVYFVRKKVPLRSAEASPLQVLSPYEEAMRSLEEIKNQELIRAGQTKLFYTKLNDVLRLFVLRKLHMASLEKTNNELILMLRQLNLPPEQFHPLAEALRMSDFVKFAKYVPDERSNDMNFSIIASSVGILNQINT
jgi:hypothetical protein